MPVGTGDVVHGESSMIRCAKQGRYAAYYRVMSCANESTHVGIREGCHLIHCWPGGARLQTAGACCFTIADAARPSGMSGDMNQGSAFVAGILMTLGFRVFRLDRLAAASGAMFRSGKNVIVKVAETEVERHSITLPASRTASILWWTCGQVGQPASRAAARQSLSRRSCAAIPGRPR